MIHAHQMNKAIYFLLFITVLSCTKQHSQTEKVQNKRNKITHVHDKIKEIKIEDVLISNISRLYLMDNFLIIGDYKPQDKQIHLFDKNTFEYITSSTYQGQGPGEITIMGCIGTDAKNRRFFVSDHGKQKIFCYDLDSVLANPLYEAKEKTGMNARLFPDKYYYINDTLSIALIIEPTGDFGFNQSVAKWNMNTGDIHILKYKHPDITQKRVNIAVSPEKNLYVECYSYHDLMSIFNLNGDLITNVYGPNWKKDKTKDSYYGDIIFCKEHILALYSGKKTFIKDDVKGIKTNLPTQLIAFDIGGNYIRTLDIGYNISSFCYDESNNRLLFVFDDEIQFGYLVLDDTI